MHDYHDFLRSKQQLEGKFGFSPTFFPDQMFPFQEHLTDWLIRRGRGALFADTGLGKTCMQLTFAENIARKTNKPVLILTPLAVGFQTVKEGEKFGIEAHHCRDGKIKGKIVVTNYQQLHKYDAKDFVGVICDESGILKNYDGEIKAAVTEFMRLVPYRALCTATAAPNDFIELGTSSEALGELGFMDMIGRFFKKAEATTSRKQETMSGVYRFRGHAERDFWRWVCSWARAIRKPSDYGFSDEGYNLPELNTVQHIVTAREPSPDFLFDMPAHGLAEERAERKRTVNERCEMAADIANNYGDFVVSWCSLNSEGDMLEKMIPDAIQVSGKDSDDAKEEKLRAFSEGEARVLVTKPSIAGWGLNWQHCNRQTFFPSHSFEQYYQSVRRSWRFGQTRPVTVDVITSEGESRVLKSLNRKAQQASRMFDLLIHLMGEELNIEKQKYSHSKPEIPTWL